MAKKPLKSQLNQIRAWAREGRTDAWIAHQLEVSASELRSYRKRHGLTAEDDHDDGDDLRDEIEAEIEATAFADLDEEDEEPDEDAGEDDDFEDEDESEAEADEDSDEDEDGDRPAGGDRDDSRRERPRDRDDDQAAGGRRRRRRRGPRRPGVGMEASFDHGETDGYGLWLDAAIADDPVYQEHWQGHAPVEVTIEPDRIVIKRSE